jgi:hypothetical protein
MLFVSFFTGATGNCPAEWADDKLAVLEKAYRISLVTCIYSSQASVPNKNVFKLPSISVIDFYTELREASRRNVKLPILSILFWLPSILTIGIVIDIVSLLIKRKISGAKVSWAIPAFFVMIYICITRRIKFVFSTGGAVSAQIASSLFGIFTSKRIVCEFQDPLVGSAMNRIGISRIVEKFIIYSSYKTVFVTKAACKAAQTRNPKMAGRIFVKYPGAQFCNLDNKNSIFDKSIKLIHVGTLYGSRNLNELIRAIKIAKESLDEEFSIEIINVGEIYCDERDQYVDSGLVTIVGEKPRQEALAFLENGMPLLIQHSDSRSEETIPYKTYDYLNSGRTIFGVLYSEELFSLLDDGVNLVSNNDPDRLVENIIALATRKTYLRGDPNAWTVEKSLSELLEDI